MRKSPLVVEYTFFFYKNKLNKDNETEIGKKNKNKLRKFKGWKVQKKKKKLK